VTRILLDPALARRMSEAGPAHVARAFSMTTMAAAYQTLFTEVQSRC
jgi:hypothetical protein